MKTTLPLTLPMPHSVAFLVCHNQPPNYQCDVYSFSQGQNRSLFRRGERVSLGQNLKRSLASLKEG